MLSQPLLHTVYNKYVVKEIKDRTDTNEKGKTDKQTDRYTLRHRKQILY